VAVSPHHLAAFMIAPFIGSFLSVLVVRLPVLDLMPLASRVFLGGRCRHCSAAIPLLYPVLELGAMAVVLCAVPMMDGGPFWASCLLGWTLLALAATDLRTFLLPDVLTLPLLLAGLAVTALFDAAALPAHLLGAVLGFGFLYGVNIFYRWLRGRNGLGLGDARLLAAAGAWLGWAALPSVLLLAAAAALAVVLLMRLAGRSMHAATPLAFGVYLAPSIWWVWLYGVLII